MDKIIEFFKERFTFDFTLDSLIHLLIAILILAMFYLLSEVFSYIITKLLNGKTHKKRDPKKHPFYKPLVLFFKVLGLFLGLKYFGMEPAFDAFVFKLFRVAIISLITYGLFNCLSAKSILFESLQKKVNFSLDSTVITFFADILKFLLIAISAVIIIGEFGFNIGGVLAGVGLGGLTIALAAQDTAKNLFGGLVIVIDKPFVVGDWISTTTIEGTVEDITFRSTRIRTFDDSVVTVPNSTLSNESITNWSRMNKRKIYLELPLTHTTTEKQLSTCLNKIKNMLKKHADICEESMYVNFISIDENSFKFMIYCFTDKTSYGDYLNVKENVNIKILKILENEKIEIAHDTQTVYIKK